MIPIPKHLKEIAEVSNQKNESLVLRIICSCGCNKFQVLKNLKKKIEISKEEKKRIRDSLKWYEEVLYPMVTNSPLKAAYLGYDKDDFREIVIYSSSDNSLAKFNKNTDVSKVVKSFRIKKGDIPLDWSEINSLQPIDEALILKVVCDSCRKEYILFDNRIHGNDVADFEQNNFDDYDFREIKIKGTDGKATEIFVTIKNYWDFENLSEYGNEELTLDDYSNMFGHIKVQANINGKKVLVYSEELG